MRAVHLITINQNFSRAYYIFMKRIGCLEEKWYSSDIYKYPSESVFRVGTLL